MDTKVKLIIFAVLCAALVIIVTILINNIRKTSLKKDIDDLYVRFNVIKTNPLAFKLNKAQAMARRSDETSEVVREYYEKYLEAQKHIDQIASLLDTIEDSVASRKFRQAKEAITIVSENIEDSEKEVCDIDVFLQSFSVKENKQREYSARLKESYREVRLSVNDNAQTLSITYDGLIKKLEAVEELFSQSEEYIYANDYSSAQEALEDIEKRINEIKESQLVIPSLIEEIKGFLPSLLDEAQRQHALIRQRGLYLEHLDAENKLKEYDSELNLMSKLLADAQLAGLNERIAGLKEGLKSLLAAFEKESQDYVDMKTLIQELVKNLTELKNLYNYIQISYAKESQRFDLADLNDVLLEQETKNAIYQDRYISLNKDIVDNLRPASIILTDVKVLFDDTDTDCKALMEYKKKIDKNTSDEERAKRQLDKYQLILNEVEVKVKQHHLPTISESYYDDLKKGWDYVSDIRVLLKEIPLNVDKLNQVIGDAREFIYSFYNNVNNIVGMNIMIENAIVFGNKYRSTYPSIDQELSKAEFYYLNGEYTKAMKISINCMETLFPHAEDKILENNQ